MAILFKNNAASTLTYKMTDVQEVLYVADASVFPVIASDSGDVFKLTLVGDDTLEIVEAFEVYNPEGRQGFKIRRAQEGTTAQAWPAGTRVEMRITAGALNSFVPTAVQIAQDNLDAVGVASTTNVGFAGVDGKTTKADADGVVTAKDVAIGGNLEDLATARGQLGNSKAVGSHDFSSGMLCENPGMYTATKSGSTNVPFTGPFAEMILGTPTHKGSLLITSGCSSSPRAAISAADMTMESGFSGYNRLITEQQVGDGITVNNGIISVPEMEGATASANGVSGLVPPPAKSELGKVLGAEGEWTYPADVAVGGNLEDLASARGQIGNATYVVAVDFNTYTKSGVYELKEVNEAANCPPTSVNGYLIVYSDGVRTRQVYYRIGTVNASDWQIFTRSGAADGQWSDWIAMLTERNLGDGFKISNHKVSVPEYEGATASAAGTSGLVPPAAAGQADYALCGDGEWKDMLGLAAHAAGPSDKSIDISFTGSTTVIAPEDGYYSIEGVANSDNGFVYLENKSNQIKHVSRGVLGAGVYAYLYVSKGNSVFLEAENCTSVIARFVYPNGNVPAA